METIVAVGGLFIAALSLEITIVGTILKLNTRMTRLETIAIELVELQKQNERQIAMNSELLQRLTRLEALWGNKDGSTSRPTG